MKNILLSKIIVVLCCGLLGVACNDFLDREPLSQVAPEKYFNTDEDLAAYAISYYSFPTHGGWGIGTLAIDNGTDNQVSNSANTDYYVKNQWKVPYKAGGWNFSYIRGLNYFFEKVLPKVGAINGSQININHYIGEVYFLRAYEYFNKLQAFGDFPIITSTLPDQHEALMEASKRKPRNEVARFILKDLDEAIQLMQDKVKAQNRLSRNAALLLKSRVALYEASFLKYHKGTPRVPGDANWPGASKDYNAGFTLDIDAEINFFLDEAMKASKELADKIELTRNSGQMNPGDAFTGWNSYFEMFSDVDMSKYDEVIFWRSYSSEFLKHTVSVYIRSGGSMGLTKAMVDAFLMKDGKPIYTSSDYKGDKTIMNTKANRDERLQLFLVGEEDKWTIDKVKDSLFGYPTIIDQLEHRDVTGYRLKKCYTFDPTQNLGSGEVCVYGSIVFRAVEAYLNYIEASYLKNGSIDAVAKVYWEKIRERAGIDKDYSKTIAATDLNLENDWGKYSGGVMVDATLFNIRRERRCELVGEGLRMMDLVRWRAMDQVKNYLVEGFNLWDEAYLAKKYYDTEGKSMFIDDGSSSANVSNKSLSKYLRPFQKVKANNQVYDGLNWSKANYLYPIGVRDLQLASPSQSDAASSVIYQNPYWPIESAPAKE